MAKKATKTIDGNVVKLEFVDGTVVDFDLSSASDEIKTKLALHGASQKIGDSYAGAEDVETAIGAATRVRDDLIAGNWTAARAGGGGGVRTTLLAEALSRIASEQTGREVSVAEATEVIGEMSDEQKSALRKDSAVKAAIAAIKLEKAEAEAEGSESSVAAMFS
jgi:hypothetical protein